VLLVGIVMFSVAEGSGAGVFMQLLERVSIQSCRAAKEDEPDCNVRVGSIANYVFVYPNFMINRYEVGFLIIDEKL
jgi:hypothetical protein